LPKQKHPGIEIEGKRRKNAEIGGENKLPPARCRLLIMEAKHDVRHLPPETRIVGSFKPRTGDAGWKPSVLLFLHNLKADIFPRAFPVY